MINSWNGWGVNAPSFWGLNIRGLSHGINRSRWDFKRHGKSVETFNLKI